MTRTALIVGAVVGATVLTAAGADAWERGRGLMGHVMARADTDGDGALTREELRRFRAERFANADADGDGRVTRDEMIARAQARAAERAGRIFDRQDRDGDGVVGAAEFEARGEARLDRLFTRADGNGDGLITPAEMRALRGPR